MHVLALSALLLAVSLANPDTDVPAVYTLNGVLIAEGIDDVTLTASAGSVSISTLLLTQQNLTKTQADLAKTQADLATAQTNLTKAQTDLANTEADLANTKAALNSTQISLSSALNRISTLENSFALVLAALSPASTPTASSLVNVVQLFNTVSTQGASILKLVNAASSSTPANENSLYSLVSMTTAINSKASASDVASVVSALSPTNSVSNLVNVSSLQTTVMTHSASLTKLVNAASTLSPGNENNLWSVTSLSNQISGVQVNVSMLSTTIAVQGSSISSLTSQQTTFSSSLSSQQSQITTLTSRLTSDETTIGTITNNITSLTTRLNSDETTIASHTTTLASQATSITSLSTSITTLMNRLTTDEGTITSQGSTISSQATSINTLQTSVTSLSNRLTTDEGNIVSLTSTVASLVTNYTNINVDVNDVYQCASSSMLASRSARATSNVYGCVLPALQTLTSAYCTSSTIGILRYNAATRGVEVCTGSTFLSAAYVPLGSLVTRPSTDCQSIINIGDSAGSGYYWLGSTSNPVYSYCVMTTTTATWLGGSGQTSAAATTSCANAKTYFAQTTSGLYWIALSTTVTDQVYCNMAGAGVAVSTSGTYQAFPAVSCDNLRQYFGLPSGLYYTTAGASGNGQVYCVTSQTPAVTWTPGTFITTNNPISCKAIKTFFTSSTSGTYYLTSSSTQAYCDMSSTGATLIMKMGGNAMCWGSSVWTSGVAYNPSALFDTTYPSGFDAKSLLFDTMSDVTSLRFVNTLGSVTVSFASASSPRTLMTTQTIAFNPYPNYAAWRPVFTQDRANAPIFMRAGAAETVNYNQATCQRLTPTAPRGCGQPCMFCFQASDDCYYNYSYGPVGCGTNSACASNGGYNDVSSGLGLSSVSCGGGDATVCSWRGSWAAQATPFLVYAQ